ncbi:GerAB/ArcD/ProY family transporter [Crassaminicella thermophila]|uniref:GerAB/ArcD/ProY family transporter n=1 Tax=Crassaminicella thermophila TaxID=2599308 RepID=A0A5C0SAE3_CRATE|nr:endospore germination permease [Crassaminicella thermophila]QEK11525.1 GerAB/ArcD/ProY family transporter [Crassaminicella thermophila]
MNKEFISDKQGISIISLFIIGSSIVLTIAGEAKKDIWIAIILSILTALPIVLVHARLLVLFPKRDLYDVLELVFGKLIGRGISILFVSFSFFLGGLVLRVFCDFIFTVSFQETPEIIPMLFIGGLCIWAAKEGIEIIGRWAEFFLIGTIVSIFIVSLLAMHKMNINNIRPILYEGIKPVVEGAFHAFIFPFTQTIVFTTFFSSLKNKSIYKVYIVSLLIGGGVLYISSVTNILTLGINTVESVYFPTYTTASRLTLGNVVEGLEVVISVTLLIGGFMKVCICLLSTCNGIAKIFGLNDYRLMVTPIGLLIINLSYFIHDNVMEKAEFASDIYPIYAFPFQVVLPIIILIVAEIKKNRLIKGE